MTRYSICRLSEVVVVGFLVLLLLSPSSFAQGEKDTSSDEKFCQTNGPPLNIVIIGASSGTTGGLFLKLALDAGHNVTAIARTPSKISVTHDNLTVSEGNVRNTSTLVQPIRGADVVIGVFGHRAFSDTLKATTLYSEGTKALLDAMSQCPNVKRLIMVSSLGTAHTPGSPFFWDFILRPFMWRFYADMSEMELLVGESQLDWTILRPPMLMDNDVPGKVVHSIEKPDPNETKWVQQVSRSDLAQVMYDVLEQNLYNKKRVYVYTVP